MQPQAAMLAVSAFLGHNILQVIRHRVFRVLVLKMLLVGFRIGHLGLRDHMVKQLDMCTM